MQPTVYDPNVPENPSDSLSDSQPELLNNFLQLYNLFAMNHVALDAVQNTGNHTYIQLLEQTHDFQTNVGEISIYVKEDEGTTDQVFIKYQGSAGQVFQYTCYQIYGLTPSPNQTSFFTFLPGRILLYFGTIGNSNVVNNNILNLYPPIATNIISVSQCPLGTIPGTKNGITIVKNGDFFTGINFLPLQFISFPLTPRFYLVMANI